MELENGLVTYRFVSIFRAALTFRRRDVAAEWQERNVQSLAGGLKKGKKASDETFKYRERKVEETMI